MRAHQTLQKASWATLFGMRGEILIPLSLDLEPGKRGRRWSAVPCIRSGKLTKCQQCILSLGMSGLQSLFRSFLILLQISALTQNYIYDARVLIGCVQSHFDHDTDGNPTHGEAFISFLSDHLLSLPKILQQPTSSHRLECKRMAKSEHSYLKAERERNIPASALAPQLELPIQRSARLRLWGHRHHGSAKPGWKLHNLHSHPIMPTPFHPVPWLLLSLAIHDSQLHAGAPASRKVPPTGFGLGCLTA